MSTVLLLVDDIVNRRRSDARALFSARRAYVNDELAAHYGLPTDGLSRLAYVPVDLPPTVSGPASSDSGRFSP